MPRKKCGCRECKKGWKHIKDEPEIVPVQPSCVKPKMCAFVGVNAEDYDIKIMRDGVVPFTKGVSSFGQQPGIVSDEYGEVFTFQASGMYRFVLDLDIVHMSTETGALKLSVSNISNEHQYLTLLPLNAVGHQNTSTTVPITAGSKVSIKQTGQTEITIKASSVKVQIYKVG